MTHTSSEWTIHRGYLGDTKGLPIADTLIFVKHKERSYEAIAIFTGEHRNVYKKDKTVFLIIYLIH